MQSRERIAMYRVRRAEFPNCSGNKTLWWCSRGNRRRKNLRVKTQSVEQRAREFAGERRFESALLEMIELAQPIDSFFDKVLVMAEDRRIRENRLRLLNRLNQMFCAVVDLAQLVVE